MSNRWCALVVVTLALIGCKKVIEAELFLEVDELVAKDPKDLEGTPLRVHGFVKRGTIDSRVIAQKPQLTFLVTNKDKVQRVVYPGPPPDKFQDQAEVIVRGMLVTKDGATVIEASDLLAKCPTNYNRGSGPVPTQYQ